MANERILVVDDEKGVVVSCVRILQKQGFTVSGQTDGQSVPDLLKQESFDLLLTDLRMPKIDGLTLLRQAKEIDPHLTVVLITGYGTMEDALKAIHLGAQGFLMKPFEPEDLVATVQESLARRALIRDSLRLQTLLPLLEINKSVQASGGETSLVRRVLSIAQRETGAARLTWLKRQQVITFPPLEEGVYQSQGKRKEPFIEAAAVPPTPLKQSYLSQAAINQVLKQVRPVWVLTDGTLIDTLAGQPNIVGALFPLLLKGEVVGIFTAETGEDGRPSPFDPISLDLLSLLAGQLAIMIENVQLFQQTETWRAFNEDIIQTMTNGLLAIDADNYITACNPAAATMLGKSTDEILYKSLPTIFDDG
ncbi:MAG: response regulator, partial [Chloroflexota bacterium]